jgi:hypothetical protein
MKIKIQCFHEDTGEFFDMIEHYDPKFSTFTCPECNHSILVSIEE